MVSAPTYLAALILRFKTSISSPRTNFNWCFLAYSTKIYHLLKLTFFNKFLLKFKITKSILMNLIFFQLVNLFLENF